MSYAVPWGFVLEYAMLDIRLQTFSLIVLLSISRESNLRDALEKGEKA